MLLKWFLLFSFILASSQIEDPTVPDNPILLLDDDDDGDNTTAPDYRSYISEGRRCLKTYDENHEHFQKTPYGRFLGNNFYFGTPLNMVRGKVFLSVPSSKTQRFRQPKSQKAVNFRITQRHFPRCHRAQDYYEAHNFKEECLVTNYHIPYGDQPEDGFPVLFFITGGMYSYGGADVYDSIAIVKNFLSRGIAVVTVQHRLGPFGFLDARSNLTNEKNLGLQDVSLAFRRLIHGSTSMGLNKNKITIGGVDSGAVLAELLYLGLRPQISGMLLIGGSLMSPWAMSPGVKNATWELAHRLGIDAMDDKKLLEELRKIDPKKIMKAVGAMKDFEELHYHGKKDLDADYEKGKINKRSMDFKIESMMSADRKDFIDFTPVFDEDWFEADSLKTAIYQVPSIPVLIITTPNEGAIRTTPLTSSYYPVFNERTKVSLKDQNRFTCLEFTAFVQKHFNHSQSHEIIKEYACKNETAFKTYNDFIGDFWFYIPSIISANIYSALEYNVFYSIVDTSDEGFEKMTGSGAMPSILVNDEYLFSRGQKYNFASRKHQKDRFQATQDILLDTIVEFVKKGDPGFEPIAQDSWNTSKFNYQLIKNGRDEQILDEICHPRIKFWMSFLSKHGFGLLNPYFDDGEYYLYFSAHLKALEGILIEDFPIWIEGLESLDTTTEKKEKL